MLTPDRGAGHKFCVPHRLSAGGPGTSTSCGRRPWPGGAARRRGGTARRGPAACRRCATRRAGRACAASCGSPCAAPCARRRRSRRRAGRDRSRPATALRRRAGCPRPAMRCWSISTALIGAVRCASAWSSCRERQRQRVGTEPALVGIELDRTEPARIAQHEVAAVGEVHAEAMPLRRRAGCSRRRAGRPPPRRRRARGRSCRGARRCARRDRAVSSTICLPRAARRGERVADERVPQRGRGRAPLQEPRVGRVHLRDLAIERARCRAPCARLRLRGSRARGRDAIRCW